ncbi:Reverse transcriptase domain-containing protein, partial [Aphis craccivora]
MSDFTMNNISHEGFTYKMNSGEKKGIRYMVCCQKFCKGSAKRLLKKQFRLVLVQRAVNETTRLRDIYDEESIRYVRAAEQYSWPLAEMSMRHARRKNVPALPPTLVALADNLEANVDRYTCC